MGYINMTESKKRAFATYLEQKERARVARAEILASSFILNNANSETIAVLEETLPHILHPNRDASWEIKVMEDIENDR